MLALFLLTLTLISATNIDNALQYRQNTPLKGTGLSASTASITTSIISSVTPTPTLFSSSASESSSIVKSDESSSDSSSPSTSVASSQPTSSSATSSDGSDTGLVTTSTPPKSSSKSTDGITSTDGTSTSSAQVITKTSVSVSSKIQVFETAIVTVSNGNTFTHTFTTSALQAVSSSTTTSESTPGLSQDNSNSGSSGLKHSQKMIIIGTVVGIGGALLLGGVGLVAWRIWGKKKHPVDQDHDLMGLQPGSSGLEKRSSVSGTSPFRSTLDQYHGPAGPVNAASNF